MQELVNKRDQYIQALTTAYADTYGEYLSRVPEKVKERIQRKAGAMKHGLSTFAAINCLGPKRCPFFHACPIPEKRSSPGPDSDYPIGGPCVLEVEYLAQQVIGYLEQLEVQPDNPVEMSLVQELSLVDLLKNRAVLVLSGGDNTGGGRNLLSLEEIITGWDSEGNARTTQSVKIHPAMEILDKLEKRRTKIHEMFAATRERKLRFGGPISGNSKLMEDMMVIKSFIETLTAKGALVDSESEVSIAFGVQSEEDTIEIR